MLGHHIPDPPGWNAYCDAREAWDKAELTRVLTEWGDKYMPVAVPELVREAAKDLLCPFHEPHRIRRFRDFIY